VKSERWKKMGKEIQSYRDLEVWKKAMQLVTDVYHYSKTFPKEEVYGLALQIRRCAVSIPSNISEGYGRYGTGEFVHFLEIATGSLCELHTQIEIARNLGYLNDAIFEQFDAVSREIERMLNGLIRKLQEKQGYEKS
jgi:four helix bundle protein